MSGKLIAVDSSNFNTEVLDSQMPVIVDFFAKWCGPCTRQTPIMEKFAEQNPNVKVVKIDVDASPDIAAKYNIRSIPTIMMFKDGGNTAKILRVGLATVEFLNSAIK